MWPFTTIKELEKQREMLLEENDLLAERVEELEVIARSPKKIVELIMGTDIKSYDPNEMDTSLQRVYYKEAQDILRKEVFTNTFNRLVGQWADWTMKNSKSFDEVRDIRMNLNGIQLFKEELENIPNPDSIQSTDDIYNAI